MKDGGDGVWPEDHIPHREAGKTRKSRHQDGNAADIWPVDDSGNVFCPPAMLTGINGRRTIHPIWRMLADTAEKHGLRAGLTWGDFNHIEMEAA